MTTSTGKKSIVSLDNARIALALAALSFATWSAIVNVASWVGGTPLAVRTLVSSMGLVLLCLSLVVGTKRPWLSNALLALSLVCLALVSFVVRT
jgi:hypothetical protein